MTGTTEKQRGQISMDDPERHRPLRVVVADDHPFYRAGLVRVLVRSGFDVVAEVANGEAAIRAVERSRPDVVVVDLNMPGISGLATTRCLARQEPSTPVMVLSVSSEETDVTDAILAGASGYVLKDRPHHEIVASIRAAAAGQSPVSPRIAAMLVRRLREDGITGQRGIRAALARVDGRRRPSHWLRRRW